MIKLVPFDVISLSLIVVITLMTRWMLGKPASAYVSTSKSEKKYMNVHFIQNTII